MLRNRDEQETTKLHGVNLAVDPIKLQFGYFERLQNWVPAQRLKIKKKRGVNDVPPGEIMAVRPCGLCFPAQQSISVPYFIDTTEPQASENIRRSWSYVTPSGSGEIVNMAVIDFTGAPFGVDSYSITTNGVAVDVPYPPTGMDAPTDRFNLRTGTSDEPTTFASKSTHPDGVWHAYYRDRLVEAHFPFPLGGSNGGVNQFTKQADKLYMYPGDGFGDGKFYLLEYDAFAGTFIRKSDVIWNNTHVGFVPMHAAPNFLYALLPHAGTTAIAKIDYADLQTTTFYDLPALPIGFLTAYVGLYALDDNLIYVIASDTTTHRGVGYWRTTNNTFNWIDQTVTGTTPIDYGSAFPTMGLIQDGFDTYLYYGATGPFDSTKIEKIGPITC